MRPSWVTVRTLGTFQSDPAAVPEPVVAAIARQLGIDDPGALVAYRGMPARWRHAAKIRDRCGYQVGSTEPSPDANQKDGDSVGKTYNASGRFRGRRGAPAEQPT